MDVEISPVDIPTSDGTADATLVTPSEGGPHPGVLMYMDAFGPRPRLVEMASRLAAEGYAVLVPNVFYRHGRAPVVELPDLSVPENRAKAFEALGPIMGTLTPDDVAADATAYLDFLARDPRVADGPVATTGYCMGGALAFRTAAAAPDRVAAVGSFHAGRLATDDPASPHRSFDRIRAEVYVAHADHDHGMPPEQQALVEKALSDAGVPHRCELYEDALHGFTMADTAVYDEAATERHWEALFGLLRSTL